MPLKAYKKVKSKILSIPTKKGYTPKGWSTSKPKAKRKK